MLTLVLVFPAGASRSGDAGGRECVDGLYHGVEIRVEKAAEAVLNEVVQHEPGKVLPKIWLVPRPLEVGEQVWQEAGSLRICHSVDYESWFFFIDDRPGQPFIHPCRYVFVDRHSLGHFEVFSGEYSWPKNIAEMESLDVARYAYVPCDERWKHCWRFRTPDSR
jgi:hypothetical protein